MAAVIRLALALMLLVVPAAAQTVLDEKRPEITLKVTLARGLSAAPGLYAFLREEAEVTAATYRDMAAEDARAAREAGQRFRPYSMEISDELRFLSPRYASVLRRIAVHTGGAHGNLVLEAVTADRGTGRLIRLDELLGGPKGGRALKAIAGFLAREIARKAHGGKPDESWRAAIRAATAPDVAVLQNFTLARSSLPDRIGGLAFHFAPYEVAPYATGPVEIVVPQALFHDGLKPGIAALFGGEPR
ncbi:MAG: DUF3298 domain-containing protein [Alphaproteobacteria bacterium]|nr:MAG: DUF3298 domain-containing protein [Alphaproteobacteria bacterium]